MTQGRDNKAVGTLKPGDNIGKYEVREQLGAGGQSIVYKCYDDMLDRFVAVKQIAQHLAGDPAYIEQFRQNIRRIAKIGEQTESIVTIHEVLEDPRGLFYVMEFVDGHTLETLLADTPDPWDPKTVLLVLFRLTSALHELHEAGIVHRDLKPGNVILTETLRPKIVDFGVAAAAGGDISMPLATTKYLAPEVYEDKKVDVRADIYSLGFMAYELLLGRAKFEEIFEDIVRDRHSQALRWMKWHGNRAVTAPAAHEVNPDVPKPLSVIVGQMIEKDPAHRFADTEQLARAIKSHFSTSAKSGHDADGSRNAMDGGDLAIPGREGEAKKPSARKTAKAQPDPTPTAPLPREPLSRKARIGLIAAGLAVVLGLISGLVLYGLQQRAQAERERNTAEGLYDTAGQAYAAGDFEKASEVFRRLQEEFGGTELSRKARPLLLMTQVQQAIRDHNWTEAQSLENQAESALEELQVSTGSEAMTEWTRKRLGNLEELREARYSAQVCWEAMQQARRDIARAQRVDEFDSIQRELEQRVGADDVNLTPDQEEQVSEVIDEIQRAQFRFRIAGYLQTGDLERRQEDFDRAEAAYTEALNLFATDDGAQRLAPSDRRELKAEVEQRLAGLADARQEAKLNAAIRTAREAGDIEALRVALEEAVKYSGWSEPQRADFQQQLASLESQVRIAQAKQSIEQGKPAEAVRVLEDLLESVPDHAEAQALLETARDAEQRLRLINRGQVALSEEAYDEALDLFLEAAEIGMDEDLQKSIAEAKYRGALARGDRLLEAKQYDQAIEAYEEARTHKPSEASSVDAKIQLLEIRKRYDEALARGDEAMKNQQWDQALTYYRQAKETVPRDAPANEIENRIKLTEYKKRIIAARTALANEDLPRARWFAKLAYREMPTEEAAGIYEQAGGDPEELE